jgi:hypothetical protein
LTTVFNSVSSEKMILYIASWWGLWKARWG